MAKFTHLNEDGRARMVSVSQKEDTMRRAVAKGEIHMAESTLRSIQEGQVKKGDVLAVSAIAGVGGAKKTWDLIPLCHNISLSGVTIDFNYLASGIEVCASIETFGKTGAEMEALTACSTALLTIYDMAKGLDRSMVIKNLRLMEKSGGKSGHYLREEER